MLVVVTTGHISLHNLNSDVKLTLTSVHRLLAADEKIKRPPKGLFPPFLPKRTLPNTDCVSTLASIDAINPLTH